MKFFRCEHCGNIIDFVKASGVPVVCCGDKMKELVPNTSDGAHEKHVPVVKVEGNKVTVRVGSVDHPMLPEHFIEWIAVETSSGFYRRPLKPGDAPAAEFYLSEGETIKETYAYCNLHGLWKA